jgi:hypothetical protein
MPSILWRRLDIPGHDACRLKSTGDGWQLEGTAAFLHEQGPASLAYRIACDAAWRTRDGEVHGWVGAEAVHVQITRAANDEWSLNGAPMPHILGCVDLDFGFTPATNLLQLRRIALGEGAAADVPVAWLDVPACTLNVLHQRYERRAGSTYWYEAPHFNYAALLEVDAAGFVRCYPGLWEAES